VESGHKSRAEILEKVRYKFLAASRDAEKAHMNLVFALLGMPWVVDVAQAAFSGIGGHTAVVLADWKAFGRLPVIQWGRVRLI
jgi:hypothetical protein